MLRVKQIGNYDSVGAAVAVLKDENDLSNFGAKTNGFAGHLEGDLRRTDHGVEELAQAFVFHGIASVSLQSRMDYKEDLSDGRGSYA